MGYGAGLLQTRMGRTTWVVFYSGPGPGLPGRRGTRSRESQIRLSDVGNYSNTIRDTNVYFSVCGPGVNVPSSRRLCGTEVTAYESLEHGVPSVCHDTTVQRMR